MLIKCILPLILVLLFTACFSSQDHYEAIPRVVKVARVDTFSRVEHVFTGVIKAEEFSNLSFQVSGPLIMMDVDAGQAVKKGTVIARIDPQDYQLQVDASKAAYITAQTQLERNLRLLEMQAISKQEYETSQAQLDIAKSKYDDAQKQLAHTKLIVPFDGFIEKKYVENYQKVQAGEEIVRLINPQKLEIHFIIPEAKIRLKQIPIQLKVEFDNYKGEWFNAKIKDIVDASPDGSGIPINIVIDDPKFSIEQFKIYPGFSCKITLSVAKQFETTLLVPLSAVIGALISDETFLWIYNDTTHLVKKHPIDIIQLIGRDKVMITGHLDTKERIVIQGGTFITEGEYVTVVK